MKNNVSPTAAQVEFARVQEAARLSGISRSALYREASAGRVKMVKFNNSTLVDMKSVRELLASLPEAPIGAGKAA